MGTALPTEPTTAVDPSRGRLLVAAAVPLHVLLAVATDLSPDEAYYLCAAREGGALPPIVDHPPLVPWLLRLTDGLSALPLELRVRLGPIALSLALGLLCVELARRRGADRAGCALAGWIGGWALLPTTAGFVATPDAPVMVALASALLWAGDRGASPAPGQPGQPGFPGQPGLPGQPRRAAAPRDLAVAVGLGLLLLAGSLAKVVVIPLAALIVMWARWPSLPLRIAALAPTAVAAPLFLPSLRFQLSHAFLEGRPWSAADALRALAEAVLVQAVLWSPWVLARGLRVARRLPPADRAVLISMSLLVSISALVRATPPEANWWAPGALVAVLGAACSTARLSPRARAGLLATVLVPTAIAAAHTLRPFLPLAPEADPTARLHGWSEGREPVNAAGVGPYGPAAERCVYRGDCDEIIIYFNEMRVNASSLFEAVPADP